MAEEEGSWDKTVEEWLVGEGYCCAGALAQSTDGAFYAAAPVEGEAGWGLVYKEDHEEKYMLDDGVTEKSMTINEAWQLKSALDTLKKPEGGLWFAGNKYTLTQTAGDMELADGKTVKWLFAAKSKGGVHVIDTGSQIICAFYDEEK